MRGRKKEKKSEDNKESKNEKEGLLFNPINLDEDEKDGVDDFENLEEFVI